MNKHSFISVPPYDVEFAFNFLFITMLHVLMFLLIATGDRLNRGFILFNAGVLSFLSLLISTMSFDSAEFAFIFRVVVSSDVIFFALTALEPNLKYKVLRLLFSAVFLILFVLYHSV